MAARVTRLAARFLRLARFLRVAMRVACQLVAGTLLASSGARDVPMGGALACSMHFLYFLYLYRTLRVENSI